MKTLIDGRFAWVLPFIMFCLLFTTGAYAESPIDFNRRDVQIYTVGAYALQTTAFRFLRHRGGMGKLPAYIIATLGTAGLSMIIDNADKRIDAQRQYGMVTGITVGTIISIAFD